VNRIAIVGATGSGKSTLAAQIGNKLDLPVIELDALFWEPNWTQVPDDLFRKRVDQALQGTHWVVGGNYSRARDIIWRRAEILIWLDYPLPLVAWRLFKRIVIRIISQEELWGGNRETFRAQFLSRESLFLFLLKSKPRHRREYPQLLKKPEHIHLKLFRFRYPAETQTWVNSLVRD
jgi:adenylate kinase family enzyme